MGSTAAKLEIRLEDGVSQPAKTAAQALGDLRKQIDRSRGEQAAMNRSMRELKSAGIVGGAAFDDLKSKLEVNKKQIGEATEKFVKLGGSFRKVQPPIKELSTLGKAAEGAEAAPAR